jgi:hypothetical protein
MRQQFIFSIDESAGGDRIFSGRFSSTLHDVPSQKPDSNTL